MGNDDTESLGAGPVPSILNKANPPPRVLVVDDDVFVRDLIVGQLREPDYKVDTARDGAEAWKALIGASYDLLITDHNMPKVTGFELIKKLRSENLALPVILVSGTMPLAELERHPELHIEATLLKPFDLLELLDTVEKVLSHPSQSPFSDLPEKLETALQTAGIAQASEPALSSDQNQSKAFHRILVVDDDPDMRRLSIDVLSALNYHVEGVKDGAAGWDAIQANSNYDLIITDNQMPRMTGIELIEKLRSAHLTSRVIMATGSLPTHEFDRRPWLKPDAMLERPYTNDSLLAAVRSVLCANNGKEGEKALPESPLDTV